MTEGSVLIVEDAVVIAEHLKMLVELQGHKVIGVVDNGEEAIELAIEHRPDLILMDIKLLGELDGIQTTRRIYERLKGETSIVYVTAYGDKKTVRQARDSGALALFTKPVRRHALDWILQWYFQGVKDLDSKPSSLQAWFFRDV